MEELHTRHRKEQRDLQSRITQKKKNASKKDRKGVNDECDALQRELHQRQQIEVANLNQDAMVDDVQTLHVHDDESETYRSSPLEGTEQSDSNAGGMHTKGDMTRMDGMAPATNAASPVEGRSKKPNRQKARLARRAAEQEAQAARAAEEAAKLPNLREKELQGMKEHLKRLDLTEITIRPDGHCMYSAVATLLTEEQLQASQSDDSTPIKPHQLVRNTAGNFIDNHPDDFAAFLEEPLDVYVLKIKNTAEWGGQLELQAVARAYDVDINVLQADGRVEKIESGSRSPRSSVWLAYYRHTYSLGEHYNALTKLG